MEEFVEETVMRLFVQHGLRLAVAESCTGGLIGHRLTNVSGASDYFLGGVIAYSNQVKIAHLDVPSEIIEKHGAVSKQTVEKMAQGVRQKFSADIGLSVSGIAGPGGGTPEKPVGTVWIGLDAAGVIQVRMFHFQGNRLENKEQAVRAAMQILLEYLEGLSGV